MSRSKKMVKERDILKALNDLENLAKGDALENADTEGGLSTEGKPLSDKAPKGRGDSTKKSKAASSSSAMSSSMDKADADSDEESDDADSDDDDGSNDDDSSAEPVGKSFREVAEDDEEVSKGLLVSPFLESLVDQLSHSMSDMTKSLAAHVDHRFAGQQEFNVRLAKGLVLVGRTINQLVPLIQNQAEIIKSFGNMPNVPQRRSVLNKSEFVEPGGDTAGEDAGDPAKVKMSDMEQWLISKAEANEIPAVLVTQWETSGRNPGTLPLNIRKAMMNDLAKAH